MTVTYEWDVETHAVGDSEANENGDILEHEFCNSYAEALRTITTFPAETGERRVIVLVRDDDVCKAWAYMDGGKLPDFFADAYGNEDAKVPQRFHSEVAKAAKQTAGATHLS
jgi:hypothetical protein